MIRETLEPSSKFAAVYIIPGNGCRFQARTDTDIDATSDTSVVTAEQAAITAPYWVKLERDIAGKWHNIAARVVGNSVRCVLDSVCVFDVRSDYSPRGRIGFYSVESKASFDSVVVTSATGDGGKPAVAAARLQSFWFSDYFSLESTWWDQYDGDGRVAPWQMTDAGLRGPVTFPGGLPTNWQIQDVADVNGDGRADFVWRNTNNGAVVIWVMNGTSIAASASPAVVPVEWQIAEVGDVTGDGKADLLYSLLF